MSEAKACECLSGIDFSKSVEVVQLSQKVYVQYLKKHKGIWFTDTGLTPDLIGLAGKTRKRKLFKPAGSVHALKTSARAINDTWTLKNLFSLSPEDLNVQTRGGGTQYIPFDKTRMVEA